MNRFTTKLLSVFGRIRAEPALMCRVLPDLKKKLHSQGNLASKATSNAPTDQEVSFADVLETNGFAFLPSGSSESVSDGLYYLYQVNGSQQSLDFQVLEMVAGAKVRHVNLDLKHTTGDVFFLNDGWFHPDVVYVVTWNRKVSAPRKRIVTEMETFIGFGSAIPSAEESKLMAELQAMKAKLNTETKGVGSLITYVRFANRYSCSRFTAEFTEAAYSAVSSSLSLFSSRASASSVA
jgi:hypothetical protein